jgi:hypothetical protein
MSDGLKLITQRDEIRSVRTRHAEQYSNWTDDQRFADGTRIGDARAFLAGLDLETCTLDDLGKWRSWGEIECDVCGKSCETLVRIGEDPDYEARWIDICAEDLAKASKLIKP